jgi:Domain of unknown function (DUF4159)
MFQSPLIRVFPCVVCLGLVPFLSGMASGDVTAEAVNQSIQRGVAFLRNQQAADGSWSEMASFPTGVTALCTLSLLNAGVGPKDPAVAKALDYLRSSDPPESTYCVALQIMVFAMAEPNRDMLLIRRHAKWLEDNQTLEGDGKGGWSYQQRGASADHSNAQFALLGLHEASEVGVRIDQAVFDRGLKYWTSQQSRDGSWSYTGTTSSGSMTCAGVASIVIASRHIPQGDAGVLGDKVICCGPPRDESNVAKGLGWLERHFSVARNPVAQGQVTNHHLYYLYGLERVGRLTGNRFIGKHDWYREGTEVLIKSQDSFQGFWLSPGLPGKESSTAMALLFLSKGKRPVVISKLQHSPNDDWNHHPTDVAQLTRHIESRWRQTLNWQYLNHGKLSAKDLLQSPVLFISGQSELRMTDELKQALREYVQEGGFIFAEACCDGTAFDHDFRQLIAELFPETPLELLPPDHPVWFAEQKVPAEDMLPLYGVNTCCRTSIVYCPEDLGCLWQLSRSRNVTFSPEIQSRIDSALAIGANVVAYATGRELKDKLDTPQPIPLANGETKIRRGAVSMARLKLGAGNDEAPNASSNLLRTLGQQLGLQVATEVPLVTATDPNLPDFPLVFHHGRKDFRLSELERRQLAEFVKHGGVLFGDAICANSNFAEAFRREMEMTLPNVPWKQVPSEHPIFTKSFYGFDLSEVRLRTPQIRQPGQPLAADIQKVPPVLEGMELDGRFVVLFSPFDLSCALENHSSMDCKGYVREDAAKIGINIILYALQ